MTSVGFGVDESDSDAGGDDVDGDVDGDADGEGAGTSTNSVTSSSNSSLSNPLSAPRTKTIHFSSNHNVCVGRWCVDAVITVAKNYKVTQ